MRIKKPSVRAESYHAGIGLFDERIANRNLKLKTKNSGSGIGAAIFVTDKISLGSIRPKWFCGS